ncbi:MAG: helix-turn-helix transcriptional regulator [Halioglobus sp.]
MAISVERCSSLLENLYAVLLASKPLLKLLAPVRDAMAAQSAVLVLRRPSELDTGLILSEGLSNPKAEGPDNPYSSHFYKLDPFTNLPEGQVVSMDEFISAEALHSSEFYQQLLQPHDIYHILAVDIRDTGGISASLRLLRSPSQQAFGGEPRQLLSLLVPHLRQILRLYNQFETTESERLMLESAVNRFSLACIILDENRRVLRVNSGAEQLLARHEGISIKGESLQLSTRQKSQELQTAIEETLVAQRNGEFSIAHAMAVPTTLDRPGLGLVVRPVPNSEWFEGQSTPSVVVFISDPEQELSTSAEALRGVFDLTPAEARLSLLLAHGNSLDQASKQLNISTNTGRAHLRSIFAKTGVTQQTQLVSLILRSVANLG